MELRICSVPFRYEAKIHAEFASQMDFCLLNSGFSYENPRGIVASEQLRSYYIF